MSFLRPVLRDKDHRIGIITELKWKAKITYVALTEVRTCLK